MVEVWCRSNSVPRNTPTRKMFQNERTLSRYENTLGVRVVSVIDRICRGCQDNCNMSDFTLETPSLLSTPSRKDFKYLLMASNAC